MNEPTAQFEGRKRDHIALALRAENEASGAAGFDRIELIHEALPEINFDEVHLATSALNQILPTPFMVSSMTAGHTGSVDLNVRLAQAAQDEGWLMGVGSQRRELTDESARLEWRRVRQAAPAVKLLGNLGLSQLIRASTDQVMSLMDSLDAVAMIIHLNSLQECLQPEGTPEFRGGLKALEGLVKVSPVPVVVKETGCGFSPATLKKLNDVGVYAVDVSGFGGTHWGRIEGDRNPSLSIRNQTAQTFANWGISTVDSVLNAVDLDPSFQIWASGGVRTGLDAAKSIALGAHVVGFAKPILTAALEGEEALRKCMQTLAFELRTALFCTGQTTTSELRQTRTWQWRQKMKPE